MAGRITEEDVLRLGERCDIAAACELLERHDVDTDDVETIEDAQHKLWQLLAQKQADENDGAASAFQSAIRCSATALIDVLKALKTPREEFRAVLHSVEIYLQNLPDECKDLLEEACPLYADTLASIEKALNNDSVLLIAGETSSGKSTVLNLLLGYFGNEFLPVAHLSSTSVLCELKYGADRKLIAHYKTAEVPPETVTLPPDNPGEVIAKYVHQKGDREAAEFPYKRVEIYWPFDWLPEGICLMDTPGISEHPQLIGLVTETLKHVFGVIYVVNTPNAGGISEDRLGVLLRAQNEAWKDVQIGSFHQCPVIFICNKWDSIIMTEKDKVKQHVVGKLCASGFTEEQVFFISARDAQLQLKAGYLSPSSDLSVLMKGIQNVLPAQHKLKLAQNFTSIKTILGRIEQILIAFNTQYTNETMESITKGREKTADLQTKVKSLNRRSKEKLNTKYQHAVEKLTEHMASADVRVRISTWRRVDCPNNATDLQNVMTELIVKRLQQIVQEWEASTQTFENIYNEMAEFFAAEYRGIWKQAVKIEREIYGESIAPQMAGLEKQPGFAIAAIVAVGLTLPLWMRLRVALLAIPLSLVIGIFFGLDVGAAERTLANIETEMSTRSLKILKQFASTESIQKELKPVKSQLEAFLEKHVQEISGHLKAQEDLLKWQEEYDIQDTKAMVGNVERLAERRHDLYGNLQMVFLEHIKVYDVHISELKLQAKIGEGAFANVFKAEWQDKQVAVKVMKSMLNVQSAATFAKEEQNMRLLQNPYMVRLYGCCYEKTDRGVKIGLMVEYCEKTLTDVIQSSRSPAHFRTNTREQLEAMDKATGLAVQLAEGLAAIHNVGYVHGDLKSVNVLIDCHGKVKLADLGLAKDKADTHVTDCSTLVYMAPEVMQGKRYTEEADMFAYGMIVWELWYGQSAQQQALAMSRNSSSLLTAFVQDPYLAGRPRPDGVYDRVMRSCWQMEPHTRPAAAVCARELQGQGHAAAAAGQKLVPGNQVEWSCTLV